MEALIFILENSDQKKLLAASPNPLELIGCWSTNLAGT
jgi:hypothetical protein